MLRGATGAWLAGERHIRLLYAAAGGTMNCGMQNADCRVEELAFNPQSAIGTPATAGGTDLRSIRFGLLVKRSFATQLDDGDQVSHNSGSIIFL